MPDVKEFVSKELSGSVSTPGLGSLSPPNYYKERHEYSAVIELQHNITEDNGGDGVLVVDVDVIIPDNELEGSVELQTTELILEYNTVSLSWDAADAFCKSKGGHLASASSADHWRKLQSFIAKRGSGESIWLGGKKVYRKREKKWA